MKLLRRAVPLVCVAIASSLAVGLQPAHAATILLAESFASGGPTSGVYSKNMSDNGASEWFFDDRSGRANQTGAGTGFAMFDSQYLHEVYPKAGFHAALITPLLVKPAGSAVTVSFRTRLDLTTGRGRDVSRVRYSLDDRRTWQTLWSSTFTEVPESTLVLELPADATAATTLTVRWESKSYNAGYWQVDDILITHP